MCVRVWGHARHLECGRMAGVYVRARVYVRLFVSPSLRTEELFMCSSSLFLWWRGLPESSLIFSA